MRGVTVSFPRWRTLHASCMTFNKMRSCARAIHDASIFAGYGLPAMTRLSILLRKECGTRWNFAVGGNLFELVGSPYLLRQFDLDFSADSCRGVPGYLLVLSTGYIMPVGRELVCCHGGRVCTGECQMWQIEVGTFRILLATAYPGAVFVCCNQCYYAFT